MDRHQIVKAGGVATFAAVSALALLTYRSARNAPPEPQIEKIELPPDFTIDYYSRDVPNARGLARGVGGTVFAGSRQEGRVYAVVDRDGDHLAEETYVLAEGLNMPSGVAFRGGALYVAAVDRVLRYDDIEASLSNPPAPVVLREDLPDRTHHGWKFIRFGPDGLLYVPVGAPCNVCKERDERFGTILRMRPDGSDVEVFALGVRNSVGFDWHPSTAELWFTDNGRDNLGDDRPPDELNHAPKPGMHFGFPYCHGGVIPEVDSHWVPDNAGAARKHRGQRV